MSTYVGRRVKVGTLYYGVMCQDGTYILACLPDTGESKKIRLNELRLATGEETRWCMCVYTGDFSWEKLDDGVLGEFRLPRQEE